MVKHWAIQCQIAGVRIQVDSDSAACQQDMWKFLCLYAPITSEYVDLTFSVFKYEKHYSFVCYDSDGSHQHLWQSDDECEISAALETHFYRRVIECIDPEICSIHAAVLNVNQQSVMFAGLSGAGKSSMCTAGLLVGRAYMSDEFTLLDEQGMVHPFPRPMQWEHPEHPAFNREDIRKTGLIDASHFDFPDTQGDTIRCHLWHPRNLQRKPLLLTSIVLHQYSQGIKKATLTEIPRHEALLELPQHLHIQRGMAKDLPMLNQRIDKNCRFYRLPFPDVFDAWRLIEQVVGKKG